MEDWCRDRGIPASSLVPASLPCVPPPSESCNRYRRCLWDTDRLNLRRAVKFGGTLHQAWRGYLFLTFVVVRDGLITATMWTNEGSVHPLPDDDPAGR